MTKPFDQFNLDRANVLSLSNFETFSIKNKLCEEPEVAFLLGWLERYWHNTFNTQLIDLKQHSPLAIPDFVKISVYLCEQALRRYR